MAPFNLIAKTRITANEGGLYWHFSPLIPSCSALQKKYETIIYNNFQYTGADEAELISGKRTWNEVMYYQIQGIKNPKNIYIRYQDFDFIAVLLCYLVLPKGLQL